MKIVIIAKLIYPTNSPRAFRAVELATELGRRGHDVVLYANLGKFDYSDFQVKNKIKVKDIGKMSFAVLNSDGKSPGNYLNRALSKLFGRWLALPDIEFLWKIPNIINQESKTDLLITLANPHPIHWGTAWIKSRYPGLFPSAWIADCGDPFMGNKFNNPPFYFAYFEKLFCREADFITIPIEEARKAYYREYHEKIHVIPQGFNFSIENNTTLPNNSIPTFLYAGNFYPPDRDPRPLLEYLSKLNEDFYFIVHTQNQKLVLPFQSLLGKKLQIEGFIDREKIIEKMKTMDFLVNFDNGTDIQSPSKLIDYAIAGRPILSIHSHNLNNSIIGEFLDGNYSNKLTLPDITQYKIEKVTDQFLYLYRTATYDKDQL